MGSSSPSDMAGKNMLENIPQRNVPEQLIAGINNIPNGVENFSKKSSPATPSGKPQVGRPPRSTGHARFRRPLVCKNIEEPVNGPNPNLQLNKNGGSYSDILAYQNIAAKRGNDQSFMQFYSQISNAGKSQEAERFQQLVNKETPIPNLHAPAWELATVGGSPNPEAPKSQQVSSTGTTLKALHLPNVGTPAPNLISNNVSGTQPAPNAPTQPGVSIRDNAYKGKRVLEEYRGWSSCPTTNANLESLLKRHRQMYSISNDDMQRLLSKFSGPKTNQASIVSGFGDSNQSLVHKPKAQCAMSSSSLIPRALSDSDMNLGAQSFLPSQDSGFSAWLTPRAPMTYADLERRLGMMKPMRPFLMQEEPKSPSELAVGPSSSNQMENVEMRNAEQEQEEVENGDEELDLDLKL